MYIAEEFAANVQGFSATDATGKELRWQKVDDEETWQIELNGAANELQRHVPGDKVDFTIVRYGKVRTVPVTLARDPYPVYQLKRMEFQRNADRNQPQHAWTALSLGVRWELGA